MSSTEGSSTKTGWNRRSSAASFSMYFWYSLSVVAPIARSSPRASAGFNMFEASMEPSDGARADERVELVDEEDDRPLRFLDLLQDRLQAVLELAAVFRAGDHRAEVERHDALVLEALGHVAHVDAAREALDDRRLADAGLADQDGVVLGPPGEHLDDAPDLFVAADDRVDLARAARDR